MLPPTETSIGFTSDPPRDVAPVPARDGLVLGLGFLLLYRLFGQDVFDHADGRGIVMLLTEGNLFHRNHSLFMPLLAGLHALLSPFGSSPYRTAVAFSGLGGALATVFTHAGCRELRFSRSSSFVATLLVGCAPAPVFFSTVAEYHGPSLSAAALSFWGMARLRRRPGVRRALALGLLTLIASGVHASGHLLPGLLLPWFLALRWREGNRRRDLALAVLAGAVHLVSFAGVLLTGVALGPSGEPGAGLRSFLGLLRASPEHLDRLPAVLWREWIRPFFPISLAVLVGFFRRSMFLEAWAFVLGSFPFLLLTLVLTVFNAHDGAYLLPMAIPAARLTVLALPKKIALLLVPLSLGLAVYDVRRHDQRGPYEAYAEALREATGGRPAALVLGQAWEVGPCLVELPDTPILLLYKAADLPPDGVDRALSLLEGWVRELRSRGREVFLTSECERALSDPAASRSGPILLARIRTLFDVEEVGRGERRAFRVVPRSR